MFRLTTATLRFVYWLRVSFSMSFYFKFLFAENVRSLFQSLAEGTNVSEPETYEKQKLNVIFLLARNDIYLVKTGEIILSYYSCIFDFFLSFFLCLASSFFPLLQYNSFLSFVLSFIFRFPFFHLFLWELHHPKRSWYDGYRRKKQTRRDQIQDEDVSNSLRANALWKVIYSSILPPVMGK